MCLRRYLLVARPDDAQDIVVTEINALLLNEFAACLLEKSSILFAFLPRLSFLSLYPLV